MCRCHVHSLLAPHPPRFHSSLPSIRAGYCQELLLERLFAGPEAAAAAPASSSGAGSKGGGGGVLSLQGWTLDMLQVGAPHEQTGC